MNIEIVGQQIAKGRKKLDISQAEFAKLVNVSPQAVGKWERGESLPDIFMIGTIGEVIGMTDINYFLGKKSCDCDFGKCKCQKE